MCPIRNNYGGLCAALWSLPFHFSCIRCSIATPFSDITMKHRKFASLPLQQNLAILILRLSLGGFMITHGLQKLINYPALSENFMDFMGLGSEISLILTIAAEAGCAVLLILGLFTRYATIPLIVTMGVAAFIAHADDPFGHKEKALLYLMGYFAVLLTGGGRFSLDAMIFKK